jgi:hypothetical protein
MVDSASLVAPDEFLSPPPDGDKVYFYASPGQEGAITIALRSGAGVTWWKGVKVFGSDTGDAIGLVETQDQSHGPNVVSVNMDAFTPGEARLEFWKAKAFGVHTDVMHYFLQPEEYVGQTLNFSWMTD